MRNNISVPKQKAKDVKGTFKRLFGLMKEFKIGIILVMVFAIVSVFFSTLGPKILGNAIDILVEIIKGNALYKEFLYTIVFLVSSYLLASLFMYAQQYITAGISQKTMYILRKKIDLKLKKLPLNYYDTNTFGDILSRVTNDVDTVSNSLQQSANQLITSLITIVLTIIMMLSISPLLTLIGFVTLPITMVASMKIVKKSQKYFIGQQSTLGAMNGYVEEMYSGHNVIKAFGKEKDTINKYEKINDELYGHSWKSQFASSIIMPFVQFLSNVGYVLVAVFGGIGVVYGNISIGNVNSFIQYLRRVSHPIAQTASIMNILQSTAAAAERVFEFLDEKEETKETQNPKYIKDIKGTVEFKHVEFGYNKENILIKDLNIKVEAGQKVAVVGPTGAGKTTIVNLIMRFYNVIGGEILIDNVNISDMTRQHLREQFGMVSQDMWLTQGTIKENIRYGKLDATDEEIINASKLAHSHGFIKHLPNGYDFMVSENGSNLSQGQRQLITIARAIISNSPILILDEATSSVDTRTEVLIQKAMVNLMKERTSFIIAHRLSTIKDSDIIIVMNKGDIVEIGNHDELIKKGGFYSELYNSQFEENNVK